MAADGPAARRLDTMKVRGRLRAVWLALWLAGAAGCVALGIYGDTPESPHEWWWLPLFLLLAAVSVGVAVRGFGRGIDADGNGVVVRNTLRARLIPWSDLAAIEFKGVDSEAITNMYYQLVFQRHDGSRVTAEAPGGGIDPGEYLFELRDRLLAMRSAALGYPHPAADRPSDAASTDAEAALESVSDEPAKDWATYPSQDQRDAGEEPLPVPARRRVKRWGGALASVAVALAIAFAPLPDVGSLLGDDETGAADSSAVDADAQRVYWEDLQPGMCVRADPNEMDYIVVDCSAEHEEEVMSRDTLARSKEYPGDAAVDDAAQQKCESAFASYVGLELVESRLDLDYLTPDKDSWTAGKVTLICLVLDPDHYQITRALRGANE
jgi:Septum formation/Bacterial PH domain